MIEEKILNTETDVTISSGEISIFTYFVGGLKSLKAFFSTVYKDIGGVNFKENDLGFENVGYDDIKLFLNNKGELLIESNVDKDFSINANGELIMEEPA